MKRVILLLFTFSLIISCRKIDVNKSGSQLLGKWELKELTIDGGDALANFKASAPYFDYFIFYPEGVVYFNIIKLEQDKRQGTWGLEHFNPNELTLTLAQNFSILIFFFSNSTERFGPFPSNFDSWNVQKLNNNKLIIDINYTDNLSTIEQNYKLSFVKTAKFE
jgi:hypothetical protein